MATNTLKIGSPAPDFNLSGIIRFGLLLCRLINDNPWISAIDSGNDSRLGLSDNEIKSKFFNFWF